MNDNYISKQNWKFLQKKFGKNPRGHTYLRLKRKCYMNPKIEMIEAIQMSRYYLNRIIELSYIIDPEE